MAHVLPISGYISTYGLLALHSAANNREASSAVRGTMRAIDQSHELPDGRMIDLAYNQNTIWVPKKFKGRYALYDSGASIWLTEVLEYIDNHTQDTLVFAELDGTATYSATGRMLDCYEVTPRQVHSGAEMIIECVFQVTTDWA